VATNTIKPDHHHMSPTVVMKCFLCGPCLPLAQHLVNSRWVECGATNISRKCNHREDLSLIKEYNLMVIVKYYLTELIWSG